MLKSISNSSQNQKKNRRGIIFNLDKETWAEIERSVLFGAQFIPNQKLRNSISIFASGAGILRLAKDKYDEWNEDNVYTIRIINDGVLEKIVDDWINDTVQENGIYNIDVSSKSQYYRSKSIDPTDYLSHSMSNDVEYDIVVAGHKISVYKNRISNRDSNHPVRDDGGSAPSVVLITCRTPTARKAILTKLNEDARRTEGGRPKKYTPATYGDEFNQNGFVQLRPINSVVLKEGQIEALIESIHSFRSNEDKYNFFGIPYHHGILLYGPPGTGKTSVVSALAVHFGLDVFMVNLSAVKDDDELMSLLSSTPAGSILLLEDVDIVSAMKERTDDNAGVTMSGILNVLDGFSTPHGLVTILTTNDINNLDKAILRPGRVDHAEEINNLNQEQLERMCQHFLGFIPQDLPSITEDDNISPADIMSCIKINLDDMPKAANDIIKLIKEKLNV